VFKGEGEDETRRATPGTIGGRGKGTPLSTPLILSSASYRKPPKVTRIVSFGTSSLWGFLLAGDLYYRGIVTIGGSLLSGSKKRYMKYVGTTELFLRNKTRKFVKKVL